MTRPSHYYASFVRVVFRIALISLGVVFLWLLLDATGVVGQPRENLTVGWSAGESPFWEPTADPAAWIMLLPPLIPLLGALYLGGVYLWFRRPRYAVLAFLQAAVLIGASLFLFL